MKTTLRALAGSAILAIATVAYAVPIPDDQLLGTVVPGLPSDEGDQTEMVRFLVAALNSGSYSPVAYPGAGVSLGDNPADPQPDEVYTLWAPDGLGTPAPLPAAPGVKTETDNPTVDLGAFQYDYLLAKFGTDAAVFWIGNLSGVIDIPNLTGNKNGLSNYLLVNPRTNVPDGGATALLFGLGLLGVSLAALRFKSSKA